MPTSATMRSPWRVAKYSEMLGDLVEQVEVGRQRGDGAVEEHHVLDEQHQLLGHAGAEAEQRLDDLLQLAHQLLAATASAGRRTARPACSSRTTSSRSASGGSAPRSRRAASWAMMSLTEPPISRRRKASRLVSSSRPVMPKSSSAVRPSGRTNRFPPCRSPWKIPWMMAPSIEADHPGAHHRLGVDPGVPHADDVVEAEAVEPLHHQHPRRHQRGVGPGDDVAALAQLGERAGDVEHVLGLEAEVELLGDGLGEQLDQRRRVGQRGDGDAARPAWAPARP